MTGDPPIGTEDAFPKSDPDETPEERRTRLAQEALARGATPTSAPTPMNANARADAIVRREEGVGDFSRADEQDRAGTSAIEDYPGQDDPEANNPREREEFTDDAPPEIAARGVGDFVQAAESLVDDEHPNRRPRP